MSKSEANRQLGPGYSQVIQVREVKVKRGKYERKKRSIKLQAIDYKYIKVVRLGLVAGNPLGGHGCWREVILLAARRRTEEPSSCSFHPNFFLLRDGQRNHALMKRQAKWSFVEEILFRKRIDVDCVTILPVITGKSHP
jgi:hypothetical protein